ncbi:hypothetical protein HanIR_Chr08g0381411 [Helianthus annuus]|nr:hypothetical protein HanIR_Chr08g0381411 [Helianthus annuus]
MYFWQKLGTKCVTKCKLQGPSMYFKNNWGQNPKFWITTGTIRVLYSRFFNQLHSLDPTFLSNRNDFGHYY